MQNQTECLNEAMFIASESYSGSTYETEFFRSMDASCNETLTFVYADRAMDASALAA